ncbi:hypothetical protein GGX14DRAFT_401605 [Mycena pura]|uniref:Uncharacterized protein n=1 Tax=Mycena pura TaxID=153505 RepID=A0AAD6V739_9AGAR|nr:hypothetical protein GGX14DRAFT_401605 [Mycena pura]
MARCTRGKAGDRLAAGSVREEGGEERKKRQASKGSGKPGSEGDGTRARPNPYTRATEGLEERDPERPKRKRRKEGREGGEKENAKAGDRLAAGSVREEGGEERKKRQASKGSGKPGSEGDGTRARPNPYTRATEGLEERDPERPNRAKLREPQARARASGAGPRAPHKSGERGKEILFEEEGCAYGKRGEMSGPAARCGETKERKGSTGPHDVLVTSNIKAPWCSEVSASVAGESRDPRRNGQVDMARVLGGVEQQHETLWGELSKKGGGNKVTSWYLSASIKVRGGSLKREKAWKKGTKPGCMGTRRDRKGKDA